MVDRLCAKHPEVVKVRVHTQYTDDDMQARILRSRSLLYYDDDHLSTQGALLSKPLLMGAISSLLSH
jgi:hypothetical protein